MSSASTCTIKLLNKSYSLRCPPDQENALQRAAIELDIRMQHNQTKFPELDSHRLLLLAALEVSHALVSAESTPENTETDVNNFIHSLEDRLQKIIELSQNE